MPAILMVVGWRVKITGVEVGDSLIERMVKPNLTGIDKMYRISKELNY